MKKLHQLTLREAARRIREGSLTARRSWVRACLTRCSRLEPRVEAWEHLAAKQAMERAEAAAVTGLGAFHRKLRGDREPASDR
jgi:Asp-tRNA(Asn)/Glu-tRNA(Gln) amidotransferase A subunit family amidase